MKKKTAIIMIAVLGSIAAGVINELTLKNRAQSARATNTPEAKPAQPELVASYIPTRNITRELTYIKSAKKNVAMEKENLSVLKKLSKVKLDLKNTTTFRDAIDQLGEKANVNIYVDWGDIQAAANDDNTKIINVPINIDMKNISAKSALDYILKSVSTKSDELDWTIAHKIVFISTREKISKMPDRMISRTYYVADLLREYKDIALPAGIALPGSKKALGISHRITIIKEKVSESGEKGIFDDEEDNPVLDAKTKAQQKLTEGIIRIIKMTIAPESWLPPEPNDIFIDADGISGQIFYFNGSLVIKQSYKNHMKIQALLMKLREKRPKPVTLKVWILDSNSPAIKDAKILPGKPVSLTQKQAALLDSKNLYSGILKGYTHQQMVQYAGQCQNCIVNMEPVVSENTLGHQPAIAMIYWGYFIEAKVSKDIYSNTTSLELKASIISKNSITPGNLSKNKLAKMSFEDNSVHKNILIKAGKPTVVSASKTQTGKTIYIVAELCK